MSASVLPSTPLYLCEHCDVGWEYNWCFDCGRPVEAKQYTPFHGGAWRYNPDRTEPVHIGIAAPLSIPMPPPGVQAPYP